MRPSDGERWTFPKGGCESGETPAQAAAREAVEEAGAIGRVRPDAIGAYRYRTSTPEDRSGGCATSLAAEMVVTRCVS